MTSVRKPTKAAICLAAMRGRDLRGKWRSGQMLFDALEAAGRASNSGPGETRNVRRIVLRQGLLYWYLDTDSTGLHPGGVGPNGFRWQCVTRPDEEPPHHPAMDNGAVPRWIGRRTTPREERQAMLAPLLHRSSRRIGERADALRLPL